MNKAELILNELFKCQDCPNVTGRSFEYDCAFPDCFDLDLLYKRCGDECVARTHIGGNGDHFLFDDGSHIYIPASFPERCGNIPTSGLWQ